MPLVIKPVIKPMVCALTALMLSSAALGQSVAPLIVGGDVAASHGYPFMASIEDDKGHFCGGTLIAPDKVLTAAHCLYDDSQSLQVRLGTNISAPDRGLVVAVRGLAIHPQHVKMNPDYDVAILTLATPVTLSDRINLIHLPEACATLNCVTGLARPGTRVSAAGWGSTRADRRGTSRRLRVVDLPVVPNPVCGWASGGNFVTRRMLCAGFADGGRDSCSADSGGPLFAYIPEARSGLQAGIVSWGTHALCGQPGGYGVYTRISDPNIRAFIRRHAGV